MGTGTRLSGFVCIPPFRGEAAEGWGTQLYCWFRGKASYCFPDGSVFGRLSMGVIKVSAKTSLLS